MHRLFPFPAAVLCGLLLSLDDRRLLLAWTATDLATGEARVRARLLGQTGP